VIGDDDVLGRHLPGIADDQLKRGRLADLDFGRGEFFDRNGRLLRTFELALARRRRGAACGCLSPWERARLKFC
jgi:hypothetical protein